VNQYNPFEDLKQNRPGVYYAGLVGGNLIQGAAGKAAGKALGLTGEAFTAESLFDDASLFTNKVIEPPLEGINQLAYNGTNRNGKSR
jgi:hypothetical protein